jgi:hypothetical protein
MIVGCIEARTLRVVTTLSPEAGQEFQSTGAASAEQQPITARVPEANQRRFHVIRR